MPYIVKVDNTSLVILVSANILNCIFQGMISEGAEIARRYQERCDADLNRRRKYLEKERDKWRQNREYGK